MPRKPAISAPVADTAAAYTSCLAINRIELAVRLGCEKEERKTLQLVEIDLKFFYPALTPVSLSDDGDYICYDKISHLIEAMCKQKEFRLIEFLGMEIHRTVRATVPPEIKIWVKLTKCSLPVRFVLGGASFMYSDLPPSSWVLPG